MNFFNGDSTSYDSFGGRFQSFINYLKNNKLGCTWQFIAYLSFIADPNKYFSILAGKFEKLCQFYGNDVNLVKNVNWENYKNILDLTDLLGERLSYYDYIDRIGVHSYMWIIANLMSNNHIIKNRRIRNLTMEEELERRLKQAKRREIVGFLGEKYILEYERKKLSKLGIKNEVVLISSTNEDTGYDILSYDENGNKILIEVKSTSASKESENGFWLSQNEYKKGFDHINWKIYRVYEVDTTPHHIVLGNIVNETKPGWCIDQSNYYYHKK